MRAKLHLLLVLGLLCSLVCYTPTVALAQTTMQADLDPWDIVQATPTRTELEVQLDSGEKLKGRLLCASATTLRLSLKNEIAEMHRNRVLKIYLLSPKPEEFQRMMRNIGAITGAAAGLEVVKDKQAGFFLAPALGGALGAFGGYAVANRMKSRMLIYDARPRRLSDPQSSGTDKP